MLPPDQRQLLTDALRPPQGYAFDRGIATTFTLDLRTLLVAPLSMAFLEVSDSLDALRSPLMLLEGVRRYADRITVFCQAGRINIPPPDNYLYSFLEGSVVQVKAPFGGVFHPKVWLLRYESEVEGQPPLYRLLNLSRNLTFDRSWDLILWLEGQLAPERVYAFSRNNPLGDFFRALPGLAAQPVQPRIARDVEQLQDEVRRVAFRPPAPFEDDLAFYPSGIAGHRRGYRFGQGRGRAMVVSPFLTDGLLRQVAGPGDGHVLISRADSIERVSPATLSRFKVYVLDDAATAEPASGVAEGEGEQGVGVDAGDAKEAAVESVGGEDVGEVPDPSGLHAKLYILEQGAHATWLVGSANATTPAFEGTNVEFMVGLRGRRSQVGIEQVLGAEGDENALFGLLRSFTPGEQAPVPDEQRQVELLADGVRNWLIDLGMRLEVVRRDDDGFDLVVDYAAPAARPPHGQYDAVCWPITLRRDAALPLQLEDVAGRLVFEGVALLSLTAFLAFEVTARVGERKHTLCFVLSLPISGLPEERRDHLYSEIIKDRGRFLRYLWLMLLGDEASQLAWMQGPGTGDGAQWMRFIREGDPPLLEALVRALSRSPEKIDWVRELVDGLRRTPEGREILPEAFDGLWPAILQVRSEMP